MAKNETQPPVETQQQPGADQPPASDQSPPAAGDQTAPASTDQAPQPPAPVQTQPAAKHQPHVTRPFDCWRCTRNLADRASEGTKKKCLRCGAINIAPTAEQAAAIGAGGEVTRPSVQEKVGSRAS